MVEPPLPQLPWIAFVCEGGWVLLTTPTAGTHPPSYMHPRATQGAPTHPVGLGKVAEKAATVCMLHCPTDLERGAPHAPSRARRAVNAQPEPEPEPEPEPKPEPESLSRSLSRSRGSLPP